MTAPRFEHDCERCVFLGHQGDEDVYYCLQGLDGAPRIPTVILRWGDGGPEYRSGLYLRDELDTPLRFKLAEVSHVDVAAYEMALERARARA